ncbi:ferritin-like domain-containing protein [Algoriphagus sp.]|uniref:ferritin-like domain-containing protein n=1 Tax=Algoriphagus sp. TaxID=1872435 RepID=UPI00391D5C80
MSTKTLPKIVPDEELHQLLQNLDESGKSELIQLIMDLLKQASTTEHLLAMQYLFTCFSIKKYPEEFSDYLPNPDPNDAKQIRINQIRMAQIEKLRRWEANILMVAREEMTHLTYVMNLLAILDKEPFLFRPNFPVPAETFPLQKPVNLMPFGQFALEIFRYWEKPDHLPVPDPLIGNKIPKKIQALFTIPHPKVETYKPFESQEKALTFLKEFLKDAHDPAKLSQLTAPLENGTYFKSIEELYTFIRALMLVSLKYKIIEGKNMERIVDEHYGFNINLNPLVLGKYEDYVEEAINQIIEEGEGVWGVPPALGSHFWVFQSVLDEVQKEVLETGLPFEPSLPVAWNPSYGVQSNRHLIKQRAGMPRAAVTKIDNQVSVAAMKLFDQAYNTMVRMLSGFFANYEIDQTTGIHPPEVNAYFQTAFYPFMTNIIRPLGELICRLPANESYQPIPGKVPDLCAGPDFLFNIEQINQQAQMKVTQEFSSLDPYLKAFSEMSAKAVEIGLVCKNRKYHVAYFQQPDARDFDVCFNYLAENFERIGKNFEAYWKGQMVAPISSKGFQNYSSTFN